MVVGTGDGHDEVIFVDTGNTVEAEASEGIDGSREFEGSRRAFTLPGTNTSVNAVTVFVTQSEGGVAQSVDMRPSVIVVLELDGITGNDIDLDLTVFVSGDRDGERKEFSGTDDDEMFVSKLDNIADDTVITTDLRKLDFLNSMFSNIPGTSEGGGTTVVDGEGHEVVQFSQLDVSHVLVTDIISNVKVNGGTSTRENITITINVDGSTGSELDVLIKEVELVGVELSLNGRLDMSENVPQSTALQNPKLTKEQMTATRTKMMER